MLVLAMQFSRTMAAGVTGLEAQQGPRHEGEGFVERPFRTEQRTERHTYAEHREETPSIDERGWRAQLANASTWESPSRGGKDMDSLERR